MPKLGARRKNRAICRQDADFGTPHAYHRFALSFIGYEEMGSFRRCARLGNESIQRWRESGELPQTVQELRACMFFEQRRWHHYGDGFDDETMAYLKELVAKLREQLEDGAATG